MADKVVKGYIRTPDVSIKIYNEEKRLIEGYASTKHIDRVNDVVLPEAFKDTLKSFLAGSCPLLFNHNPNEPVGKIVAATIDDTGLYVKAEIGKGYGKADDVWAMIKDGVLKAFSIGFIPLEMEPDEKNAEINYIKKLELLEISIVSVPANREALFTISEDGKSIFDVSFEDFEEKQVAPYRKTQPLDTTSAWDKRKAIFQLRKYASSDGSGDPDKMNWNKYFEGFFYRYDDRKNLFTGYKLPYCYVENGKITAVRRGIMAVAAVLQGARGGTNIPKEDQEKIKKVVSKWYKRWGGVAPWDRENKELTTEEVLALIEDVVSEKEMEFEEKMKSFENAVDSILAWMAEIDEKLAVLSEAKEAPSSEELTIDPETVKTALELAFKELKSETKNSN